MRLEEISAALGCELEGDGSIDIRGIATLEEAGPGDLSFLSNPRYAPKARTTRAAAIIVGRDFAEEVSPALLRTVDPYFALARALELFHRPRPVEPGIHPTAVIDPSARIGPGASIGPYVVIEARARIGARARLGPYVLVGAEAEIGDDFTAHAHATVRERVRIGNRVILQDGAVIGSDGFGYAVSPDGKAHRMPQTGTVILEDDVEVGANATVDRATVGATRIGRGTKIDNLVMIAHGCEIGEGCFLAAQVGLAGSTKLGRGVQLGGQVGVAGHLEIGDFARIAAQSGVPNDVPAGKTFGGTPAVEIQLWRRVVAATHRLPEVLRRLRRLEKGILSGEAGWRRVDKRGGDP